MSAKAQAGKRIAFASPATPPKMALKALGKETPAKSAPPKSPAKSQ